MKAISTLFICVLISSVGLAQSLYKLEGRVKDAKTGEALPGVSVYIPNLQKGTSTNEKGYYQISLKKGKYNVEFSFVGYAGVKKQVKINNKPLSLSVELAETSQQMEGVKVVAKSEAREIHERGAPVTVVALEEIRGQVSSVNDVLSKTSGIKIRNTGGVGAASRISVRGLEGKRIGFFIDGTPMSDNSDFMSLDDLPVDLIERIEIYKGCVPPKFGGSSIGGAVNIVTKEYPARYLDVAHSIGSFGTHVTSVVFKRHLKKQGILLGVGGFHTLSQNDYKMELPYKKGTWVTRDHDRFEKRVLGVSAKWRNTWFDEIVVEVPVIHMQRQIQGIKTNVQHAENDMKSVALASHLEKKNAFKGLDIEFDLAYGYSVGRLTDTSAYDYDWYGKRKSGVNGELFTYPRDTWNRKNKLIAKFNSEYVLTERSKLYFNSLYFYTHNDPKDDVQDGAIENNRSDFKSKSTSSVNGLTYDFRSLDGKFLNSLSAKHYYYSILTDHYDNNTGYLSHIDHSQHDFGFTNSFRFKFTQDFMVKASAAYDIRLPLVDELLGDNVYIRPSQALKPENNLSFNLGVLFDRTRSKKRHQIEFNVFYMNLDNFITLQPTYGPLLEYANKGKQNTIGMDFEVKSDLTSWFHAYFNFTYQEITNADKYEPGTNRLNTYYKKRLPNIPYLFWNAGIEFHKANLIGKRTNSRMFIESSFVEEFYPHYKVSNVAGDEIPRSLLFNLGLEQKLKNERIIVGLNVNNITDQNIQAEFRRPLPGRNYSLKLRYILK